MVAQSSSAGGDCAPRKVRITFAVTIDVTVETLPEQPAACQHTDASEPCKCHKMAAPEPEQTIGQVRDWVPKPGTDRGSVSADGRFEIAQPAAGAHQFVACDHWTGERAIIYDRLPAAIDWCESRIDGQPLKWRDAGSGFSASLSGASFRVNYEGGSALCQGVDCRFAYSHQLRHSPFFDSPEAAQRWCEVRAACRVDGEGATSTLHYVGPAKPQS